MSATHASARSSRRNRAVTETDPFDRAGGSAAEASPALTTLARVRSASPYVMRMRLMWQAMRQVVLKVFPPEPGLPTDEAAYLRAVDEVYRTDAYHSLSIEGYRVTDALIRRVTDGDWNPQARADDADARNAMAARGYWLAHNAVKLSILMDILRHGDQVRVVAPLALMKAVQVRLLAAANQY